MPLFVCSKCQCIDNTLAFIGVDVDNIKPLCCMCSNGSWHKNFSRVYATPRKIVENFVEYYHCSIFNDIVSNSIRVKLSEHVSMFEHYRLETMSCSMLMEQYKLKCYWNRPLLTKHIIDVSMLPDEAPNALP